MWLEVKEIALILIIMFLAISISIAIGSILAVLV